EKKTKIDAFEKGGSAFDDTAKLSKAVLTYRPFPEAWTIHEHVVHFLESDIATFTRYRRAIAQPSTLILGYDEEVWTPALDYHTHDLGATLSLIKGLRSYMAAHLRTIADKDWTKLSYIHSSSGRVNLEEWIDSYVDHIRFHRELIERNLKLA